MSDIATMTDAKLMEGAGLRPRNAVRRRCRRRSPKPARSAGCARTCSPAPLNIVLTIVCALLIAWIVPPLVKFLLIDAVWDGAEPGRLPADGRIVPRSAPAGPSSSTASTSSPTASIRSRSAGGSTCSSRCWRSASSGWLWLDAPRRDLGVIYFFVILPIASLILLLGWPLIGLSQGRDHVMGRRAGDRRGGGGRHRVLAADRHPAGARPPLAHAGGAAVLGDLHRVRARRAADHRAVHGERDAAAVRARRLVAGQAAARAGRRRRCSPRPTWPRWCAPACRRSRRASTRPRWRWA